MDLANDITALVAGGDVIIDGAGPSASRFKGIVFAEGSIEFRRTTVIGASISADPNGSVVMDEVTAANAPETNAVVIEKDVKLEEAMVTAASIYDGADPDPTVDPSDDPPPGSIGVLVDGKDFYHLNPRNEATLKALAPTLDPKPAPPATDTTNWNVVVKTDQDPPNDYAPGDGIDFARAARDWGLYVGEHAANRVERIDVFDLDLNRALSITDQLEVKLRRSRPYRK